jgi:hypothetical protein
MLNFLVELGSSFLSGLALNCSPPNLLSSWDCTCELPCLALYMFLRQFCYLYLRWPLSEDTPASASSMARITGMYHHAWLIKSFYCKGNHMQKLHKTCGFTNH